MPYACYETKGTKVEILYLLIPLAMLIVAAIVVFFLWAVRSGQFDDLEGPAHGIIMDDDKPKNDDYFTFLE